MSEQHPNTEPTSDEPIFWKDGKQYIRLYYFMPAKYLFDVLLNDEIKVSLPENCNDPLEFVATTQSTTNGEKRLDGGFISFSSRFDTSLMWAHYADAHRGVCLRFDFPIKDKGNLNKGSYLKSQTPTPFIIIDDIEIPEQFICTIARTKTYSAILAKVVYRDERPTLTDGIIGGSFSSGEKLISLDLSPVFFTKATEWRYEHEWRLFVTPALAERFHDNAFFVTGLTQHITGIFLGKNYQERDETTYAKILQCGKSSNNSQQVSNKYNRLEIDRAAFHEANYSIILPRLMLH